MVMEDVEINICHLFYDLLNDDTGNISILKYRCEKRGIKVNIIKTTIGDVFDAESYDIVFIGDGQDYAISTVANSIDDSFKDSLKQYIEDEKVMFAVCGGYQLLGESYITLQGTSIDGFKMLPIRTEEGNNRLTGDIIIESDGMDFVGFENHSGRTYIGDLTPLGTVTHGYGNNEEDKTEGCIYKNTYCTYMHGLALSKNPELADILIQKALNLHYGEDVKLEPIDDTVEQQAKEAIINRYT